MGPIILIPCKSFSQGKSRLSSVLSVAERDALCRRLLASTLALASELTAKRDILVVSADAAVSGAASDLGFFCEGRDDTDLNAALGGAVDRLPTREPHIASRDILILPIDLALATPRAMAPVIAAQADLVLVPDAASRGTNILRLRGAVSPRFSFRFGDDSFSKHVAEAKRLGLSVDILRNPDLGFDIDTPADYVAWIEAPTRSRR